MFILLWKTFLWNLCQLTQRSRSGCQHRYPIYFSTWKTISREILSLAKFMLAAAAAITGVPYISFHEELPPPWKFNVVTLCALLTRDLLAIAKFLVNHFEDDLASQLPAGVNAVFWPITCLVLTKLEINMHHLRGAMQYRQAPLLKRGIPP